MVNDSLVYIDHTDIMFNRARIDYNVKYVRSTDLAKKMYKGSIFGEDNGMLEIRTPKDNIYKVPISGHYTVNDHHLILEKHDVVEISGSDRIEITRIK